MAAQSYENHSHRPVPTLVAAALLLAGIAGYIMWLFDRSPKQALALALFGLLGATLLLVSISRLYVTRLQDRIIKLEMRIRARDLLTPAQQEALSKLDSKQIAALRFASFEHQRSRREVHWVRGGSDLSTTFIAVRRLVPSASAAAMVPKP